MEMRTISIYPEVLIDVDAEIRRKKKRKEENLNAFAKDIARQCVAMEVQRRDLAKGILHRGAVYTAKQLRDIGVNFEDPIYDNFKILVGP